MSSVETLKLQHGEGGFSLTELLVALLLSSIIFVALTSQYSSSVHMSHDQRIKIETLLQAQATMLTIGSELRQLGNGVPFDQPNFQIGENTLTDVTVTEPILIGPTTTSNLVYRLNETGEVSLLTASFTPAVGAPISLTSVDGLAENDPIYISNSVVSGDDGLYGLVDVVDDANDTITLQAGYEVSPGATFDMGSILQEVATVTITNGANGITRDSGFGAVLLAPNATFSVDFLDFNGATVATPLTHAKLTSEVRSVRINVTVNSTSNQTTGDPYSATVQSVFGLRNLNYLY